MMTPVTRSQTRLGRQTRRRLLAGPLPGAALLAACAVGQGESGPSANDGPLVALEYLTQLNPSQNDNYQRLLVDALQKDHPRLRLTVINSDIAISTKLKTLVAAGSSPDATWFANHENYLGKLVVEVTDRVKRDKVNLGVYNKELFEAYVTWKGQIMGLPNQSGGNWPVMPYNRELLAQAGVPEPPASWTDAKWNGEAWVQALQRLTRRNAEGVPTQLGINLPGPGVLTVNWGPYFKGAWVSDDLKTVTCDTPQMIEAYEYLANLVTRLKVMGTANMLRDAFGDNNAERNFLAGKLAMYQVAGGATSVVAEAVRARGLPIAYAPLPSFKTGGSAQNLDSNGVPAGSKHPDEAWTFVKWSANNANWSISRGNAPARADLVQAWAKELYSGDLGKQMRLEVYADSLKHVGGRDPLFLLPTYRDMRSAVIDAALNKLWAGEANAATILRESKAPLQAMMPKDLP